jgi:hypothetical protein
MTTYTISSKTKIKPTKEEIDDYIEDVESYIDKTINRLTREIVLELLEVLPFITANIIDELYPMINYKTASKQLNRMRYDGILRKKQGFPSYMYFLGILSESSVEHVKKELIQHWKETDHPGIRCLPVKMGGTVEGGSGQGTMFRYVFETLAELGFI